MEIIAIGVDVVADSVVIAFNDGALVRYPVKLLRELESMIQALSTTESKSEPDKS